MDQALIKQFAEYGAFGLFAFYILKRLDKVTEMQAGLIQLYTILITSLPEMKKRSKDEAERINAAASKNAKTQA